MTPQEQKQCNEIGRLNRIIDDLRKDKAALHQDVIGQREVMEYAAERSLARDHKGAYEALKAGLDYRQRQREPRKTRVAI